MSLRGNNEQSELVDDDIKIEWSFVYADETGHPTDTIFYRESKLTLQLVPLPSLMLQSVSLLPCNAEHIPKNCRTHREDTALNEVVTTDHLYCLIMVHLANPTETTFRFRLRREINDSGDVTCEAEIGRQCSRRFVVELPRFHAFTSDQGSSSLIHMLNDLLEMEWETYFGTRGRLLCKEYHLGTVVEQEQMKRELLLSPISFDIHSSLGEPASAVIGKGQNGSVGKSKHGRDRSLSLHPLSFFQATNLSVESRVLQVGLFQYVPISISIKREENDSGEGLPVSCVEIEVVVTDEDEVSFRDTSDNVMVVGQLKTQVVWNDPVNYGAKVHDDPGNFLVTVCGRVLDPDMKQIGGEVWCHQSMHVCVRLEDAIDTEKTVNII
ncbi:hypothetical protein PHPALM_30054 [Phytophthora palmivora]|uniref:Uncharacterized protein n=1 Tax=Phytophthora palmivora TaxID=4796 RepID=A0A2P4X617_9STRA|nr:hypothetical protein PHPALM_30054 [Phytophthora palmivora]